MEERQITLEPEIWDLLCGWSEQECRTVAGQIKYLVKHYAPSQPVVVKPTVTPTVTEDLKPLRRQSQSPPSHNLSQDDNGWEYAQLCITHLKSTTKKMSLLETIIEYADPVTNMDLLTLAQAKYPHWKSLNIDTVTKQTSALFHSGLLKRKTSGLFKSRDQSGKVKHQYILHPRAMRLVKRARLLQSSSLTDVYVT
ncbi:MAG TPA: hypothetical protein DCS66_16830 [Flavobacteriaceae bacterium]|nr:hypothetical protein [Flavobacteriaceae bacterium]